MKFEKASLKFFAVLGFALFCGFFFFSKSKKTKATDQRIADSKNVPGPARTASASNAHPASNFSRREDSRSSALVTTPQRKVATDSAAGAEQTPKEKLLTALKKYDPKAEWTLHEGSDQRISLVIGGVIPVDARKTSVLKQLTDAMFPLLGLDPQKFYRNSSIEKKLIHDDMMRVAHYQNKINGYEVLDSYVRVFYRNSDGGIFNVTNESKTITQLDTETAISPSYSKTLLANHLQNKQMVIENANADTLKFSVNEAGQAQLSRQYNVYVPSEKGRTRQLITISAKSGEVLSQQNLTIKN